VVISDDEEVPMLEEDPVLLEDITEEYEEEWVASPAPVAAPEPLLEEAVQVPAPAAPEVEDEPGWTSTYLFKYAPDMAYYHSLLLNMLEDYYPDLNASIKYYCAEHTHPWRLCTRRQNRPSQFGMKPVIVRRWRMSIPTQQDGLQ